MAATDHILSLATAQTRYARGLERMVESARRSGFAGEFLLWRGGTWPAGCPSHRDVPFAFKPYGFREARARGVGNALWLDSSCVVVGSLGGVFR